MIDRKFQRPLHLFSWVACGAMAAKLVFFTEFNSRHPGPHVFTDLQAYADKKMDEFFGVETIRDKATASSSSSGDAGSVAQAADSESA